MQQQDLSFHPNWNAIEAVVAATAASESDHHSVDSALIGNHWKTYISLCFLMIFWKTSHRGLMPELFESKGSGFSTFFEVILYECATTIWTQFDRN